MASQRIKSTGIMLFLVLSLCCSTVTRATENGGGAYPNGAEGFGAGMVPPPGTYFLNYLTYYSSGSFRNQNGHDALPDFNVDSVADVLRVLHVTKYQVLGGNWGMHVFVPVVYANVTVPGKKQRKGGIGDIIVDPFILSWHSKNFHAVTGIDIYLPTGLYDRLDPASLGRNYYTFEPIVGATYLTDSGFEASVKMMYDINTINTHTDYTSGQEFHFDYTLAQKVEPFTLGIGGYFYKQVTDDKQHGLTVAPDGFKGQVFAVGPQVKFDYRNMFFLFKYQKEFFAENRPEGDKIWLNMMYAF